MRHEVRVLIDERQEFTFELVGVEPMAPDVARQWLDEQFTQLECEPLRASGKLLLADKVLVVAQAGGAELLADPTWGQTCTGQAGDHGGSGHHERVVLIRRPARRPRAVICDENDHSPAWDGHCLLLIL